MRTTIAILTRSTITLLPALFLFGANLASAALITEVTASAVSYGSDHVGPAIPTTTSTPGQIVHQSESANGRDANGNVVGSVTGTSSAATNFGVDRVGLTTALFGILTPETNTVAYVNAGTYSNWMDGWTITGGTAGDLVSVFVSGRTTYDLPLTGGAVADPGRLTLLSYLTLRFLMEAEK